MDRAMVMEVGGGDGGGHDGSCVDPCMTTKVSSVKFIDYNY